MCISWTWRMHMAHIYDHARSCPALWMKCTNEQTLSGHWLLDEHPKWAIQLSTRPNDFSKLRMPLVYFEGNHIRCACVLCSIVLCVSLHWRLFVSVPIFNFARISNRCSWSASIQAFLLKLKERIDKLSLNTLLWGTRSGFWLFEDRKTNDYSKTSQ